MELKLPAEGPLTFKQKCELSYVTLAVVSADKLLADATKQQLVQDAALGGARAPCRGVSHVQSKARALVLD